MVQFVASTTCGKSGNYFIEIAKRQISSSSIGAIIND